MYESLLEWIRFPFLLIPYKGKDLAGDEQYGKAINAKCYRVDDIKEIRDVHNDSYWSSQQLYCQEGLKVSIKDMVAFPEDPDTKYEIRKIGAYYDGNTGGKSITVLYL